MAKQKNPELTSELQDLTRAVKSGVKIDRALEQMLGVTFVENGPDRRMARCPFHEEKTPSFAAYPNSGKYVCYGCGEKGDIFNLVKEAHGTNHFHQALVIAADSAGISVPKIVRDYIDSDGFLGMRRTARKTIKYDQPQAFAAPNPENLAQDAFTAIPEAVPAPKPREPYRIWNNGGSKWVPKPTFKTYTPSMVHEYKDVYGTRLMSVMRLDLPGKKKIFMQARMDVPQGNFPKSIVAGQTEDGKPLAYMISPPRADAMRPVYGMEDLIEFISEGGKNILIVEGEKTRDYAKALMDELGDESNWLVLSPMGGCQTAPFADWSDFLAVVAGRSLNVVVWPDADPDFRKRDGSLEDRQQKYILATLNALAQQNIDSGDHVTFRFLSVQSPKGVEAGWDLADAKKEGWTGAKVLAYMQKKAQFVRENDLCLRPARARERPSEESSDHSKDAQDEETMHP